jgi:hypothetical protein
MMHKILLLGFFLLITTIASAKASLIPHFSWTMVTYLSDLVVSEYDWEYHDSGTDMLGSTHNWHYDYTNVDLCMGYSSSPSPSWDSFLDPVRYNEYPETFTYSQYVYGNWVVKRKLTEFTFAAVQSFVWTTEPGVTPPPNAVASRSAGTTIGDVQWKWQRIILPGGGN